MRPWLSGTRWTGVGPGPEGSRNRHLPQPVPGLAPAARLGGHRRRDTDRHAPGGGATGCPRLGGIRPGIHRARPPGRSISTVLYAILAAESSAYSARLAAATLFRADGRFNDRPLAVRQDVVVFYEQISGFSLKTLCYDAAIHSVGLNPTGVDHAGATGGCLTCPGSVRWESSREPVSPLKIRLAFELK